MQTHVYKIAQLGELIVAAFDSATRYSTDPREVSRLATQAVTHLLRRVRRTSVFAVALEDLHPSGRVVPVHIRS